MCANPTYTESVITGNCNTYGYTQYTCTSCGYSYKDHYTLFSHTVSLWEEVEAATLETEGLELGHCDGCGIEQTRTIPVIEPEPETEPTTIPETEPQETAKPQNTPKKKDHTLLIIAISIVVICSVTLVILLVQESNRKRRRKKGGKFKR